MRFSVPVLVALTLTLAGCGRGDGQGPAGRAPTAPATPTGGAPAQPAVPPEGARPDVSVAPTVPAGARIRPPAVAGQFYPGEKEKLRKEVARLLGVPTHPRGLPGRLRALIVPHAGYVYSGGTAGAGFCQLRGKEFDRVVLLGSPHQQEVRGISLADAEYFGTPLGPVAVDRDFARRLAEKSGAGVDREAHAQEHSLEVQLPFLLETIGPGVRIVPVLVETGNDPAARKLAGALAELLDERTVVVVSTDLSHYPPRKTAEAVDRRTVESWATLDAAKVAEVERRILAEGHPELACTMCGSGAVYTLMHLAPLMGIDQFGTLASATSAQAGGDDQRVVGYAAAAFCATGRTPPVKPPAAAGDDIAKPPEISAASRKRLLALARESATAAAAGKAAPALAPAALPADLRRPGGAFVTLKNKGELRGCIGRYPGRQSVAEVVREMAVEASRDSRFEDRPVTAAEMKDIDVEISVLSPLVKIDDWKKIKLGVHGVVLRRGWSSGVFLPQVATETGWKLEESLSHLASDKAGLAPDAYKDPRTEILVFTALVFGEKEEKP